MQLKTLELFCRVADRRSFSRAADESDLTQSAVSQAIGHLEESIGTRLIDRSKRPLILTPAGRKYLAGVRELIRRYQDLEEDVRTHGQALSGTVTVGAIYSVGLSYMPEATEAFAKVHPDVKVRMEFGSNQRVTEMVLDGSIDFGLVSFPKPTKTLGSIPWLSEPMRLVCSAAHPLAEHTEITAEQLNGMELVGFDRNLMLRQAIDACLKRAGISVETPMEFDNADSMVRAIQANRGIGIVPESVVRRETAIGTLKIVACRELQMVRPLGIVFRRRMAMTRAATEFGSLLLGREMEPELRSKSEAAKLLRDLNRPPERAVSVIA